MNRLRYLVLAAVCLIVPANTVWSAPVPGARSGLEQIPETAPVVVHVRGVQGVHDRLVSLMKLALPELLDKYKDQIDDFFEKGPDNALKGRKIRGLAKDGPLFFALLELPKVGDSGEPKMAFILTITDYKEFVDNILTEEERKNAKDEGDGYVMAIANNYESMSSDLVIADAQKLEKGVIGTVKLPFRLRSGTHTNWYPQSALPPIKDELT